MYSSKMCTLCLHHNTAILLIHRILLCDMYMQRIHNTYNLLTPTNPLFAGVSNVYDNILTPSQRYISVMNSSSIHNLLTLLTSANQVLLTPSQRYISAIVYVMYMQCICKLCTPFLHPQSR